MQKMISRTYRIYATLEVLRIIGEEGKSCSERTLKIRTYFESCFLLPCLNGLKNQGIVSQWRDDDGWAFFRLTDIGRQILEHYLNVRRMNKHVYAGTDV